MTLYSLDFIMVSRLTLTDEIFFVANLLVFEFFVSPNGISHIKTDNDVLICES